MSVPIPLYFDSIEDEIEEQVDRVTKKPLPVLFYGERPTDSLEMHTEFLQKGQSKYHFKFPPKLSDNVQEWLDKVKQRQKEESDARPFTGMNPRFRHNPLQFESNFESGNLDMVLKSGENEYDLYMRVDSNTRGHNQWFYFKVWNKEPLSGVRFNVVNFTKRRSLYETGMQVCIFSQREHDMTRKGWVRGGYDICYRYSKLN